MTSIMLRRSPWQTPIPSFFERDFLPPSMNRLMDFMAAPLTTESIGLSPAMEVSETDSEFICTAELPGISEKDVHVTFEGNELRIKGEKSENKESQKDGKRFHVLERSYGAFERAFAFPADVDAGRITAEFKDGVLTVHLPKSTEAKAKSRMIPITAK
jgi:HSP20 family protein